MHERLPTIADFNPDLREALHDRFALSKADAASHPFVTGTVIDPATKPCELFPASLRFAAYSHVCELMGSRMEGKRKKGKRKKGKRKKGNERMGNQNEVGKKGNGKLGNLPAVA